MGGEFETRGASRVAEPEVTREGVGESRAAGRARGASSKPHTKTTEHDAVWPKAVSGYGCKYI